jgi:hypothetical protein
MSNKTEYQVGQAVIISNTYLVLVNYKHSQGLYGFKPLLGNNETFDKHESSFRPATEAEILAEIQKHGWAFPNILNIDSPSTNVYLQRTRKDYNWQIHHVSHVENYEIFGNECLVAHTIITALNLAK